MNFAHSLDLDVIFCFCIACCYLSLGWHSLYDAMHCNGLFIPNIALLISLYSCVLVNSCILWYAHWHSHETHLLLLPIYLPVSFSCACRVSYRFDMKCNACLFSHLN